MSWLRMSSWLPISTRLPSTHAERPIPSSYMRLSTFLSIRRLPPIILRKMPDMMPPQEMITLAASRIASSIRFSANTFMPWSMTLSSEKRSRSLTTTAPVSA